VTAAALSLHTLMWQVQRAGNAPLRGKTAVVAVLLNCRALAFGAVDRGWL
jgi:hypothetical protein